MAKNNLEAKPFDSKRALTIVAALAVLLWGASIVIYGAMAGPFLDFWVDDAGISFTFVRNIAEGYGSVVAPGTERVEGFSNPTWVALLAMAYKLGGDPFTWSQRFAYVFALGILALVCLYGFMQTADGRRLWPVALAAPLVALNASFVIWNQSGLENSLYGFLITASLLLVIREGRNPQARPWSAITLFLLAITRPEGGAHTAIAGTFLLLTDMVQTKRPSKRLFVWAGGFLLLFGGYHLWHYIYFAHPFPNTYYAKVRPETTEKLTDFNSRGWKYISSYLQQFALKPLVFLALPAFLSRQLWREALYIALTMAFLVFFPVYSQGDWMEGWRFLSNFPVPLAMLLGLAAFNMGEMLKKAVGTKLPAKVIVAVAVVFTAAWVVAPTVTVVKDSTAFARRFAKHPETSVKKISVRARWWSKIAYQLALRPYDTVQCDMDMGGTSYNWPGVMMDIGYLLDVPMATHRYTDNWREMMNEYFFEERRPEFIHIRRSWGKMTTIPGNAKFKKQYLQLPEDRKFGNIPNGNYVRRDLIESYNLGDETSNIEPFTVGIKLAKADVPTAMRPGKKVPIILTWTTDRSDLPVCEFAISLVADGAEPSWLNYKPVMGWLPTDEWKNARFYSEVVYLEAPVKTGMYRLMLAVKPGGQESETRTLPQDIRVDMEAAKNEAERILAEAEEAAQKDALGADRAFQLLRSAERIVGSERIAEQVKAIEMLRLRTYVMEAEQAAGRQEYFAAAELLARCWRIDAKDKALIELGWRVAKKLYEIGRNAQAGKQWDEAYDAFSAACKAQPQHAWARRRAEEVRMRR